MKYYRKRYRPGRLRKRWYFNAGANLPVIGRTSVAFGSGKSKRSIINTVRRGLEDPLHKLWSQHGVAAPSQQMTMNTLYTLNLCGNIPQGDNASSRTADNIHLDALKMRLVFTNNSTTNKGNSKTYRVIVCKHDAEHQVASDAFGSGLGALDLFQGNNNSPFEFVNPKNVSVIYDKKIKLTPAFSTQNQAVEMSDLIRFNSTYTYKSGTNVGKFHNYYLVICGYEDGGSTGTTNVGFAQFYGDLIFKDSK